MAGRPPRRAAAIRCTQVNSSILNTRRGRPGPIPAPLPVNRDPSPLPPLQAVLDQCVFCHFDVDPDQNEIEMCKHCCGIAHHRCADHAVGPNDRQCRDLCGYTPPIEPTRIVRPSCPRCRRTFRLTPDEARARWIRIFQTNAWTRYVRRRRATVRRYPHQIVPSIAGANPYFNQVYQPDDLRFIRDATHQERQQEPWKTQFVTAPNTLMWGTLYNDEAGAPFRLNQGSHLFRLRQIQPNPVPNPVFRNRWFPVHPSLPQFTENDPSQQYMFSELIILMHSDRPVWKRFCKMFDDLRLNLNQL